MSVFRVICAFLISLTAVTLSWGANTPGKSSSVQASSSFSPSSLLSVPSSAPSSNPSNNPVPKNALGSAEKEAGLKIFMEMGGGTLFSIGTVYKFNPIFGAGIGLGFTPAPAPNNGPSVNLKVETIPFWFDLSVVKINLVIGIQAIFFLNDTFSKFVAADLGGEIVIPSFPWIVPSLQTYWYLIGEQMFPQIGIQLRYNI